ncbi:hypothetical protein U9M48_032813 [Paspalum notatum var. saurae]|uniref:SWIM-type domain-containing protein n=1 Tax=Paspalum notatum var. saurae TaxID=547442 RepID=A0AAQ3U6M1_PASNO
MIQCRLDVRVMKLSVDVIEKEGYKKPVNTTFIASSTHAGSMVTGTIGDSGDCTGTVGVNEDEQAHIGGLGDWDSLVVIQEEANDDDPNAVVDEAAVYVAMGFAAFDNEVAEQANQEYGIPGLSAEMDNDTREAAIPVDDNGMDEAVVDWDRDNPDMVQKINGDHCCASAIRLVGKMASQAWVAERCIPLLKEKKNMGAKEVKDRLYAKYRLDIPYQIVWFKAEVELRSTGSVVEIARQCPRATAICSDACKGLIEAVKKVFLWAEHRECFRHLKKNMKRNFTGTEYAKYMWPAARVYTLEKHKYLLGNVLESTPGIQKWLEKDHSLLWTRSKFSEQIKCDYINNNLAESWNGCIKDLPPDAMADVIREKMEVLFKKRRKISMALSGSILPVVVHQLNAVSKGLTHLRVTKGNSEQAEVTQIYKDEAARRHVVYLNDHHCTCRQWQISGKPCPHALPLITTERQPNMEPYVDSPPLKLGMKQKNQRNNQPRR